MRDKLIFRRIYIKAVSVVLILLTISGFSACGDNRSNDSSMTENLIDSYLNALCDYNMSAMNRCCMANREQFSDSDAASRACKAITGRIEWEKVNISIDGNSAIAQIKIRVPENIEAVCRNALNDTVKTLDSGYDGDSADLLVSAIKKRAGSAKKEELTVEIHMAKVDNKWYIVKSLGVNLILSSVRTPVASVFAIISE